MENRGVSESKPARKKKTTPGPTYDPEIRVGYPGFFIAGVDEVGRGCLAGPVVAGAVILPPDFAKFPWASEIADSKLLSSEARSKLAPLVEENAVAFGIGVASVEEIDQINIFHASHLAMKRAIEHLTQKPAHVLVDGKFAPRGLNYPCTPIVKGDQLSVSIAAASIIAKVWRDQEMRKLDSLYPGYGFSVHKGYGTPEHSRALRSIGACAIHRRSFAPVAEALRLKP